MTFYFNIMSEMKFRAWDKLREEFLSAGQVLIAVESGRNPSSSPQYLDILTDADMYRGRFIIMPYIGKKDYRGREIYVGDIVRIVFKESSFDSETHENIVEVNYDYDRCGYIPFIWDYYCDQCDDGLNIDEVEVIGNIFEDPELLQCKVGE